MPVIDLIDAIKENVIDYSVVKKSSGKLGAEVSSYFHYRSINSQWVEILYGSLPPLRRMRGPRIQTGCGFFKDHFYYIDVHTSLLVNSVVRTARANWIKNKKQTIGLESA